MRNLTSYKVSIPGEPGSAYQIVITVGGEAAGGATFNDAEKPFPWISLLYVPVGLRRRRWGTRIIKKCIELAPAAIGIQLWVHKDNDAAITFYQSLGFVKIGEPDASTGRFGMQLTLNQGAR